MLKLLLLGVVIVFTARPAFSVDFSYPNNKFGIHLAQPHFEDLEKAAQLVNSNGGDWGYVTLVIQENDRDHNKWQDIFEKLRELHLIPLIRLATQPQGDQWRRPSVEDVEEWVNFLDSLNWVVKNRYIVLFNEPNHAKEWGGAVDVQHYGKTAFAFAKKLREKNKDFFVMLAGFDASAPSRPPFYENEETFLKQLFNPITIEQFNNLVSGWVSHSYPNPAFIGSPYNSGRGSIRTYHWELQRLKQRGIKDLPVFITESGWDGERLSREQVAEYLHIAFRDVWLPDEQVAAITPFILNYQSVPFTNFSWQVLGTNTFYPQYHRVREMAKKVGNPEIREKGEILHELDKELVVNSTYHYTVTLKNTGQAIWEEKNGYRLRLEGFAPETYLFSDITQIKPNHEAELDFYLKTNSISGKKEAKIVLYKSKKKVLEGKPWTFEIRSLPDVLFDIALYPRMKTRGEDFEFQLFNEKEQLFYKKSGVKVMDNKGKVEDIQNIALNKKYRVVLLKSYYLPRQQFITFQKDKNTIAFKHMYPVDFNKDGKFDVSDLVAFAKNPKLITLFFP